MKKIRNLFIALTLILSICTLSSCKGKEQTFTSNGITVTLNSKFKEQTIQGAQVVYATNKLGFMGNAENKSVVGLGDNKLEQYTKAVIDASSLNVEYQIFDEDGVKFGYAYYSASVSGIKYKYMLVTKEGKDNYYTMNFWSFEKSFNKNENQFMEWAKQIVVE